MGEALEYVFQIFPITLCFYVKMVNFEDMQLLYSYVSLGLEVQYMVNIILGIVLDIKVYNFDPYAQKVQCGVLTTTVGI